MKKSFNIIAILLLCSLLLFHSLVSTGCCRINGEVNALTLKSNFISEAAIKPPRRFFFGIKGYVSNMVMIIPFPPIIKLVLLLDLPLEALADLLMIPVDSIVYLHYLMNPPLSLLIEKHKNDQLETMLKKGIDPNKADYRYDPGNTLAIARASNNSTAAKLLLEYGAKLPANAAYFFNQYPSGPFGGMSGAGSTGAMPSFWYIASQRAGMSSSTIHGRQPSFR